MKFVALMRGYSTPCVGLVVIIIFLQAQKYTCTIECFKISANLFIWPFQNLSWFRNGLVSSKAPTSMFYLKRFPE